MSGGVPGCAATSTSPRGPRSCLGGAGLALLGKPRNTGICASCFAENVAGALRLHQDPRMSYLRPDLMGFVLGATLAALAARGFRARGGSAPLVRFFMGGFLVVGWAIFLGCPIKVLLRLAGGDWTAVPGVAGLVAGAWVGVLFLRRGSAPWPTRSSWAGSTPRSGTP